MVLAERVLAAVAGLRLTAPNVAAMGAQPDVEGAAALLAGAAAGCRDRLWHVGARTGVRGAGEVHARAA